MRSQETAEIVQRLNNRIQSLINQLRTYINGLRNINVRSNDYPQLYQLYCLLRLLEKLILKNCEIIHIAPPRMIPGIIYLPLSPVHYTAIRDQTSLRNITREYKQSYSSFIVEYTEHDVGISSTYEIYYNLCIPHYCNKKYRGLICHAPDIAIIALNEDRKKDYAVAALKEVKYRCTGNNGSSGQSMSEFIRIIIGYNESISHGAESGFIVRILHEFSELITNFNIRSTQYWRDKELKMKLFNKNVVIKTEPV